MSKNEINSTIPIELAKGGTATASYATAYGVVYSTGSALATTSAGSAGQVLTSQGASMAPVYNTISTSGTITQVNADVGTSMPVSNVETIKGGTNMNTSASGSTFKVNLNASPSVSGSWAAGTTALVGTGLTVTSGGIHSTGTTTLSSLGAGVMQTNSSGVVSSTKGTDGQTLISSSTVSPAWATLTAGTNITITNAANSITIAGANPGPSPGAGTCSLSYRAGANSGGNSSVPWFTIFGSTGTPATKIYDVGSNWSNASSPAHFIAPQNGIYLLTVQIRTQNNTGPNVRARISWVFASPATTVHSTNPSLKYEYTVGDNYKQTDGGLFQMGGHITVIRKMSTNDVAYAQAYYSEGAGAQSTLFDQSQPYVGIWATLLA